MKTFDLFPLTALFLLGACSPGFVSSGAAAPPLEPEVASLASDRGISLDEARERLRWQVQAGELEARLRTTLGERFGGVWISDTDGTDRVKAGMTEAADYDTVVHAASELGIAGAVDAVVVKNGIPRLERYIDSLTPEISEAQSDALVVGLAVDANHVFVETAEDSARSLREQSLLGKLQADLGDALEVRRSSGPAHPTSADCDSLTNECKPPLRGGVVIHANKTGGGEHWCTAGFVVQDSHSTPYLMTAGHCLVGTGTNLWATLFPGDSSFHTFGRQFYQQTGPNDVGLIAITNSTYWQTWAGIIMVRASPAQNGVAGTTQNFRYPLRSTGTNTRGKRVCISGANSFQTRCGSVTDTGLTRTLSGDGTTETITHLNAANISMVVGDSGAPVFANNQALGILIGYANSGGSLFEGMNTIAPPLGMSVVTQ